MKEIVYRDLRIESRCLVSEVLECYYWIKDRERSPLFSHFQCLLAYSQSGEGRARIPNSRLARYLSKVHGGGGFMSCGVLLSGLRYYRALFMRRTEHLTACVKCELELGVVGSWDMSLFRCVEELSSKELECDHE
jgi:hypothetical protein